MNNFSLNPLQQFHLVSFADKKLIRSLNRLKLQADEVGCFSKIFLYTEDDLSDDFKSVFGSKLSNNIRGFGYWCWKPEVILMALEQINEGQVLLYIDAGCHINKNGLSRLYEYFELAMKSSTGILAFKAVKPDQNNSSLVYDGRKLESQPNYMWIKGDVFSYFDVINDTFYTHGDAIGAGIIFLVKSDKSLAIIREWLQVIKKNFALLDDTPSKVPNFPRFIEHRHDQAIWTILCLKNSISTLSAYEYWYPKIDGTGPDWVALKYFPIHAKRDKVYGFFGKINRLLRKSFAYFGGQL